jgi:hypothetical protein
METPPEPETQSNDLRILAKELHDLSARLDERQEAKDSIVQATDKWMTWTLRIAAITISAVGLLAAGGLAFGVYTWASVRDDVADAMSTQVGKYAAEAAQTIAPPIVELMVPIAVSTLAPPAVERAAGTAVAQIIPSFQPTFDRSISTSIAGSFQTVVPNVATTFQAQVSQGQFAVIVASDTTTTFLENSATALRERGYDPDIYKVGDVFALVLQVYPTQNALQEGLLQAKEDVTESAYFIDLTKSCARWEFVNPGYFNCALPPSSTNFFIFPTSP